MRFIILAGLFTAVIVSMILMLESGDVTKHKGVSPQEKKLLSKLPRP